MLDEIQSARSARDQWDCPDTIHEVSRMSQIFQLLHIPLASATLSLIEMENVPGGITV